MSRSLPDAVAARLSPTSDAAATALPPRRFWSLSGVGEDFKEAGRGAAAALRTAPARVVEVVSAPHRHLWAALFALVWVAGIAADAYTTQQMMALGLTEEANPIAAWGMGVVGRGGYIIAASLWCLVPMALAISAPYGRYGLVILSTARVLGVAKLYIGASNALLWWQLTA